MRGALREMRVNYDQSPAGTQHADIDIAQLRERIGRNRTEPAFELRSPTQMPQALKASVEIAPNRNGYGRILPGRSQLQKMPPRQPPNLRQSYVDDLPLAPAQVFTNAPIYEPHHQDQVWEEPARPQQDYYEPPYAPPPAQTALVSPNTAYSAQNSFQQLTDAIMARASGERGLEGMTQDLLRGMLKTWLDDNLPQLVEKLVREEIERVARRGR